MNTGMFKIAWAVETNNTVIGEVNIGIKIVLYFHFQMTQKYGSDSSVTGLLNKMDFIILPVFNVDGYAYTWINPVGYTAVV